MKPAPFDYVRPETLPEALAIFGDQSREIAALAGGQSLMPMMNFRLAAPELLVDLGHVKELSGISEGEGQLRIGAMTRYADLEGYPGLAQKAPLVSSALPHIAHSAIRNRGTIGGSVALADPAAEMPAILIALGATIELCSADTQRHVPADAFFTGIYETARDPTELVTAITLPLAQSGNAFGFEEVTRRHGDYAMAGVAIAKQQDALRIAFFSVADRPTRAGQAENILAQDPTALDAACDSLNEIDFSGDLNAGPDMKKHLAGVVLRRAWAEVTA